MTFTVTETKITSNGTFKLKKKLYCFTTSHIGTAKIN